MYTSENSAISKVAPKFFWKTVGFPEKITVVSEIAVYFLKRRFSRKTAIKKIHKFSLISYKHHICFYISTQLNKLIYIYPKINIALLINANRWQQAAQNMHTLKRFIAQKAFSKFMKLLN